MYWRFFRSRIKSRNKIKPNQKKFFRTNFLMQAASQWCFLDDRLTECLRQHELAVQIPTRLWGSARVSAPEIIEPALATFAQAQIFWFGDMKTGPKLR